VYFEMLNLDRPRVPLLSHAGTAARVVDQHDQPRLSEQRGATSNTTDVWYIMFSSATLPGKCASTFAATAKITAVNQPCITFGGRRDETLSSSATGILRNACDTGLAREGRRRELRPAARDCLLK